MATIHSFLADTKREEEAANVPPIIEPDAASDAVAAPVPEDLGQKVTPKSEGEETEGENEAAQRSSIQAMKKAQVEESERRKNQTETARLVQETKVNVQQSVSTFGRLVNGAALKIGNLAMPGDILLPLFILLLFFFALIPIGGHTRIQWLWLAISGNASISSSSATGSTGGGTLAPLSGTGIGGLVPLSGTSTGSLTPLSGIGALSSIFSVLSHVEDIG